MIVIIGLVNLILIEEIAVLLQPGSRGIIIEGILFGCEIYRTLHPGFLRNDHLLFGRGNRDLSFLCFACLLAFRRRHGRLLIEGSIGYCMMNHHSGEKYDAHKIHCEQGSQNDFFISLHPYGALFSIL